MSVQEHAVSPGRRLGAVRRAFRGVLLVAAGSLVLGLVAAAPAQAALPKNCSYDKDRNGWVCVKVTSDKKNSTYKVADTTVFENTTRRVITGNCEVKHSKTWTYGASATISASAGVIFAKVDSAVSANLEHSRTSEKTSGVGFSVGPGETVACDSGVYTHKFKGTVTHTRCGSSACSVSKGKFTLTAPSVAKWRVRYY